MLKKVVLITLLQEIIFSSLKLAHCATISSIQNRFSNEEASLVAIIMKSLIIDELDNNWINSNPSINITSNTEVTSFLQLAEVLQVSALKQNNLIQNSNNIPVQLSIKTSTLPLRNRANNYQRPQQVQLPQAKPLPSSQKSKKY